jgi:hypothetical protein
MILSTSLMHFRAGIGHLLGLTISLFCLADPAPIIHYAPVENLERSDVALIDQAEQNIDIAAYVLTDWLRAAQRGGRTNRRAGTQADLSGTDRDRSAFQAHWLTFDASQKLPNRRTMVAHGRRKLFGLWADGKITTF